MAELSTADGDMAGERGTAGAGDTAEAGHTAKSR